MNFVASSRLLRGFFYGSPVFLSTKPNTFKIPIPFGNSERIANPLLCAYASDKSHFIYIYYGTIQVKIRLATTKLTNNSNNSLFKLISKRQGKINENETRIRLEKPEMDCERKTTKLTHPSSSALHTVESSKNCPM